MSTIGLESLEVLTNALEEAGVHCTASELFKIVDYFARYGHQLTPVPVPSPVIEPAPIPNWPPPEITSRLWAIDMDPDRDTLIEVRSAHYLEHVTDRGASLIQANNAPEAKMIWRDCPDKTAPAGKFTWSGINYQFHFDEIPF